MPGAGKRISAPFSPPDCPWKPMSPGSAIPDSVCKLVGKLNGENVYIGRIYDDDDVCYYAATAIPSKGICIYLNKKLEVKTTDTYDILTISCGEPLAFRPVELGNNLLFVAGGDEDKCLYCSRVVDGENTYYGWADKNTKTAYIPRESNNKLTQGYDILIHQFLDRLCVCPMPPNPPPF